MGVAGAAVLVLALVHAARSGWHAPLAVWVAPLGVGLLVAGAWSSLRRQPLPRWATGLLWAVAAVLSAVLVWQAIYILTRQNTLV